MHVHKNDTVLVIAGNALGKQGKVLKVFPDADRVIIENVNIVKRHARPNQKNPQGGIVQKEGPISASNVMVICPKCSKATRIGHTHVTDPSNLKRKTMRVCKTCKEMF
ncbi:MAG: ribosomal protein [Bacteroidetes bacterium]|jgi:large subunit ribosomal protein L24|nr:ribosomal protein [Bacteroidota bacterium]TSA19645.1 MAG: 50S ribosomal protein L24 [bacterium]